MFLLNQKNKSKFFSVVILIMVIANLFVFKIPINAINELKNLTYENMASNMMKLLVAKTPKDGNFIRCGKDHDGGYIMLDKFKENSLAYSIGIMDDISWDQDIAKKNINVFMYDHTINQINVSGYLHFFKTGVCGENTRDKDLLTLEEMLIKDNNISSNDIILKMDVEGAEWDVFDTISDEILKKFSQIVVEFHSICDNLKDKNLYDRMIRDFEKLNKNHQIIHVHANNYGKYEILGGVPVADVIEITYLRKDENEFLNKESKEAQKLDMKNNKFNPEYVLCLENFR